MNHILKTEVGDLGDENFTVERLIFECLSKTGKYFRFQGTYVGRSSRMIYPVYDAYQENVNMDVRCSVPPTGTFLLPTRPFYDRPKTRLTDTSCLLRTYSLALPTPPLCYRHKPCLTDTSSLLGT